MTLHLVLVMFLYQMLTTPLCQWYNVPPIHMSFIYLTSYFLSFFFPWPYSHLILFYIPHEHLYHANTQIHPTSFTITWMIHPQTHPIHFNSTCKLTSNLRNSMKCTTHGHNSHKIRSASLGQLPISTPSATPSSTCLWTYTHLTTCLAKKLTAGHPRDEYPPWDILNLEQ
jgi:hypothetical protein